MLPSQSRVIQPREVVLRLFSDSVKVGFMGSSLERKSSCWNGAIWIFCKMATRTAGKRIWEPCTWLGHSHDSARTLKDISEHELSLLLQRYYNADTGGISYMVLAPVARAGAMHCTECTLESKLCNTCLVCKALDKEIQSLIDEPCAGRCVPGSV